MAEPDYSGWKDDFQDNEIDYDELDDLIYTDEVIIKNLRKEGWTCEPFTTSDKASLRFKGIRSNFNNLEPKIIEGLHVYVVYLRREKLFGRIEDLV